MAGTPVSQLPNIGEVLAQELANIDIHTLSDLKKIGSVQALLKIRGSSARGCYNMLYALEGAIHGIRWHGLTKEQKAAVKSELDSLTGE